MKEKIEVNLQSSIRIEDKNKVIYFDPYKINEEKHDARMIFITHDHFDHLDYDSIKKVMNDETFIIVPSSIMGTCLENGLPLNQLINVIPNKKYNMFGNYVETIPSYNKKKEFHTKDNKYVGYLITIDNEVIYVAGDTDMTSENKKVKCDIALVPIGGTYTMDYKEASELINIIKPKVVIPTHYKTIVGSDNDVEEFKKLLDKEIECVVKY